MKKDFSHEKFKRYVQHLNLAHQATEKALEDLVDTMDPIEIVRPGFLKKIHSLLYSQLPGEFRFIHQGGEFSEHPVEPGSLRRHNVCVGDHVPPSPEDVPMLLKGFAEAYDPTEMRGGMRLVACAAAHHRLAWIHPFSDGNGRVTRLHSGAWLRALNINPYATWSISRGMSRNEVGNYTVELRYADSPAGLEKNDGSGPLSEEGLAGFCEYFIKVCLDQVAFVRERLELHKVKERIDFYVTQRSKKGSPYGSPLRPEAAVILKEAFRDGEVERGRVAAMTSLGQKTAQNLVSQLLKEELLHSTSHRAPLTIGFPLKAAQVYFPQLYPSADQSFMRNG